jgi:hypothetical protein
MVVALLLFGVVFGFVFCCSWPCSASCFCPYDLMAGLDAQQVTASDLDFYRIYGSTQAFIAVKSELAPAVLKEGYKVSLRDAVPCSIDPPGGVQAFRNHNEAMDMTVLEVHDVPEDLLDREAGKIKTKHLENKHLRDGAFRTRGKHEYADAPCPLCGQIIPDRAEERGRVDLSRWLHGAFMVVPCDNDACIQQQQQRQQRLDTGKTLWLYHETDRTSAELIKAAGGKMIRGTDGVGGGGIYLGLSASDCREKSLHDCVILKCRVKIGEVLNGDDMNSTWTFAKLICQGKDTLWLRLCYGSKSYVVHSWDQVQVAGEVDDEGNYIA